MKYVVVTVIYYSSLYLFNLYFFLKVPPQEKVSEKEVCGKKLNVVIAEPKELTTDPQQAKIKKITIDCTNLVEDSIMNINTLV